MDSSDEGLLDIELEDLVLSPRQTNHAGIRSTQGSKRMIAILMGAGLAVILLLCVVVVGIAWAVSSFGASSGDSNGSTNNSSGNPSTNTTPSDLLTELKNVVVPSMDLSADPCEDFYQYACGGWIEKTKLPADKSVIDLSFSTIADRNEMVVKDVLEEGWPLITPFYDSCTNVSLLDSRGRTPLNPFLAWVDGLSGTSGLNASRLFELTAQMHLHGLGAFFSYYVGAGLEDTSKNVYYLYQGGLGLPSADYYLNGSSKLVTDAYVAHIATMLQLANVDANLDNLTALANDIFAFEKSLAEVSMSRAEMRNPHNIKLLKGEDLQRWATNAGFDKLDNGENVWLSYFSTLGVDSFNPAFALNVAQVNFTQNMLKILHSAASSNPETVRGYLQWHIVNGLSAMLSVDFRNERFRFRQILYGLKEEPPRWQHCVQLSNNYLGFATGHYFVQRMFPADSRTIAHNMIENIEASFHERIQQSDWMDDSTKAKAIEKLGDIHNKVGYPDKWPLYEGLQLYADKFFENIVEMRLISAKEEITRIGNPVDKNEWGMYPSEVNAYYSPSENQVVFPAGIMQPRFFNHTYLHSMNYGGMGAVIGHELSHGFDDEGSQYNGTGSLQNWWSNATRQQFEQRTQCLSRFYSKYTLPEDPSVHVNGNLTLGENLADLGGVKVAFFGYHKEKERFDEEEIRKVFGMSSDQLFFVSYAQNWCEVASPEYLKYLVTTNPHSPGMFRVLGPLSNTPEFSQAYQCPVGARMNPQEKCLVW